MNLKKLTQAVFEGLPSKYRWAAVDECGAVGTYISDPSVIDGDDQFTVAGGHYIFVGDGYDTTDWQNSKIERLSDTCIDDIGIANAQKKSERQDVPSVGCTGNPVDVPTSDIDWSRQDVPAGATHYQPYDATKFGNLARYFKDDFSSVCAPSISTEWKSVSSKLDLTGVIEIPRPESIHDVARSIEAARVAEKVAGVINFADLVLEDPVSSLAAEYEACMLWPDGDSRYFETSDVVNNPAHYITGGIECIDAMQAMLSRDEFIGYLRGNIFKYQWSYKHKNGVEDLRKADWYAQRLITVEGEK